MIFSFVKRPKSIASRSRHARLSAVLVVLLDFFGDDNAYGAPAREGLARPIDATLNKGTATGDAHDPRSDSQS